MTAVSDSSPLISLARIGHFELLSQLFETIYIPVEVYDEIVVAGACAPALLQKHWHRPDSERAKLARFS